MDRLQGQDSVEVIFPGRNSLTQYDLTEPRWKKDYVI